MHYVKYFDINGVATKQVACIELQGAPNAATEGAVGVLGMDMLSPTHEVYKCVAVNGSVYTWELLATGMSILCATITREGALVTSFAYEDLKIPNNYLLKVGDLILDTDGYVYQVNAIGNVSCDALYCGTHLGGSGTPDKDYRLVVTDGKLKLVTESGNVLSEVDILIPDETTIHRDPSNGNAHVMAIKTIDDTLLRFFKGTQVAYNLLSDTLKQNIIALNEGGNLMVESGGTGANNANDARTNLGIERFRTIYDRSEDKSEDFEAYAKRKFTEYGLQITTKGQGLVIYFDRDDGHHWAMGYYSAGYGKFIVMQYHSNYGIKVFDCYADVWTVTNVAIDTNGTYPNMTVGRIGGNWVDGGLAQNVQLSDPGLYMVLISVTVGGIDYVATSFIYCTSYHGTCYGTDAIVAGRARVRTQYDANSRTIYANADDVTTSSTIYSAKIINYGRIA